MTTIRVMGDDDISRQKSKGGNVWNFNNSSHDKPTRGRALKACPVVIILLDIYAQTPGKEGWRKTR